MGNIICIILLVVGTVCLVGTVYYTIQAGRSLKELERINDVASYRLGLIYRCHPDVDLMEKIVNKHTYEEMLKSSKPLGDHYWFTPEEIKKINNYKSHLMGDIVKE